MTCTGTYQGREIALVWGDQDGDREALDALAEIAADRCAETLVLDDGERVSGNLLAHPAGFVYCCALLLSDFQTDYEPPGLPEGFVT